MTLVPTPRVILQYLYGHRTFSTVVTLTGREEAQRDVGWLCPSTGAPNITQPQPAQLNSAALQHELLTTTLHDLTSTHTIFTLVCYFPNQGTALRRFGQRIEAVRDEPMHRLGCSYIVNIHESLVIQGSAIWLYDYAIRDLPILFSAFHSTYIYFSIFYTKIESQNTQNFNNECIPPSSSICSKKKGLIQKPKSQKPRNTMRKIFFIIHNFRLLVQES